MTFPRIVTFCGSSRFVSEMAVLQWEYEKAGWIALGLHLLPMGYAECWDHLAERQGVAAQMDELHLRKIELSGLVFVVNVGGYIGDSTRREIEHATQLGKRIVYLEEHDQVTATATAPPKDRDAAALATKSDPRLDEVTVYQFRNGARVALCNPCARAILVAYGVGTIQRTDWRIEAPLRARCLYAGWNHP